MGKIFSSECTLNLLGQCGRTTWPTVTYRASLDVHKKDRPRKLGLLITRGLLISSRQYLRNKPERKTSDIVATWGTHLFRCKPPIACASHPTPPPESGLKGVSGQTIVTEFSAKQYRCKDASHVMYIDTMQQPDDFIFEVSNWCKQANPWTNWHLRLIFARMTKHLRYIHTSITYESGWLWIGTAGFFSPIFAKLKVI